MTYTATSIMFSNTHSKRYAVNAYQYFQKTLVFLLIGKHFMNGDF